MRWYAFLFSSDHKPAIRLPLVLLFAISGSSGNCHVPPETNMDGQQRKFTAWIAECLSLKKFLKLLLFPDGGSTFVFCEQLKLIIMKNLKTFSLVAAIAICALCLFDFNVTDGERWLMGERHENVISVLLSCVGSCAFMCILLTYFLLTRKEHGFGSWVGVAATGFGILSAVLYMMYLSEIDSAAFKNGDYEERDIRKEDLENLLLMAVMFIVICQFTILAAVGSLASFAKTDAMKWIVAGLIVAHVLPHIEHILTEFFKPEFSDYEHWDNAHEKYELAREAYKERCDMFHTIVGYLPVICWAIYFFYLAFKKDDAPQVEVAAVQGSVPKPATLVNPVAVSEPETVVPEQKSHPEQSAPEPPVSASGPVSD